jgi:hypothetical protein
VYTLRFAIRFNKTHVPFTKTQVIIHNIMIWVVPFIWIVIIGGMIKSIPGSYREKKDKGEHEFYDSRNW